MRSYAYRLLLRADPIGSAEYSFLRRHEWDGAEEIELLRRRRLDSLLRHARCHVPFYQESFEESGIPPGRELEFFSRIPLLRRRHIRNRLDSLRSDDARRRRSFSNHTGGSTGEPLQFVSDRSDTKRSGGALLRWLYSWYGIQPGEREVKLWGSERDLFYGTLPRSERFLHWFRGHLLLNAFRMTPEAMTEHIRAINWFRPRVIRGYCHNLYELARHAEQAGLSIAAPRVVISSAGTLHAPLRKVMERLYGTVVCNHYGSREVHTVAWECPEASTLHVSALTHTVEILDEEGRPCPPGVEGNLVITSHTNYSMPFIRYLIGDRATFAPAPCSCGRSFPCLSQISGRASECFRTRGGAVVPGEYFIHLLGVVFNDGIFRKLQVVQEDYDHVVVLAVLAGGREMPSSLWNQIADKIRLVMGTDCRVELKEVSDIPASPSGKYPYTVSRMGVS